MTITVILATYAEQLVDLENIQFGRGVDWGTNITTSLKRGYGAIFVYIKQ